MILKISIGILILIALMLLNIVTVNYNNNNIINYSEQTKNLNTSKKTSNNNNLNISQNKLKSNEIGKYNPKSLSQGLYGLPEVDPYMSELMKQQINSLSTKFYYDNCKYVEK
tara:strand:- start:194 stop:529 length:336 start_codon:yes stop_codon:yes gene_type:complete